LLSFLLYLLECLSYVVYLCWIMIMILLCRSQKHRGMLNQGKIQNLLQLATMKMIEA